MASKELCKSLHLDRRNEVSLEDRCSYFRKALAVYLFYYYLPFASHLFEIFGAEGMVNRAKIGPLFAPSLLFLFQSDFILVLVFLTLLSLSALLLLDRLSRFGVLVLFLLNLSFQNANPYILHEPQQLASLFLFTILLFLPVKRDQTCDPFVWKTLLYALGVYYAFAGLKKLVDPLWGEGQALYYLLQWDALAKHNVLSDWLVHKHTFISVLNYSTLFFEMTFLIACFTRFFPIYWWIGIFFHASILFFLEVGSFSAIMFVWYALFYPQRKFQDL